MIYGIVWLLSDVSLVQLHYFAAAPWLKFLLPCLIAAGAISWQVLVRQRDWRWEVLLSAAIIAITFWRVGSLPPPELPAPQPGVWVGRWVGLPGKSSALFQPLARVADASDSADVDCAADPPPYRLWVRGIKRAHHVQGAVKPGLCVTLSLVAEPERSAPPSSIESWRQRHRIVATFRLAKASGIEINRHDVDPVDHWRLSIRHQFEAASPLEQGQRWSYLAKLPVLLGLVTGDRVLMGPSHWRVFADTGTSHLMAISGSHVGMFAVFVYLLVKWLVSRFTRLTAYIPAQHLALIAGWLGAFSYALLAGFNVPTQRTLVMIGVAVVLKLRGHSLLDWRAWWLALVAVTVYDPLAIFDRGAWLSFFAVALILWVLQGRLRAPGPVRGWLLVQWGIFVGLTPLLLYAFGGFPWISGLANAVAIPVMGFVIVPGAMLAALLLALDPPGSAWLLALILAVTDALLWFLQHVAAWGGAGYRVPLAGASLTSITVTLAALLAVLWWLAPRGVPGKPIALALMLPVLAGPGFHALPPQTLTWLAKSPRQSVLYENDEAVWWIFEAGTPWRARQPVLEAWLNERGYGYRWDPQYERYADWVRQGFLVHRYEKYSPIPGQIHLRPPALSVPCQHTLPQRVDDAFRLEPVRAGENQCWLALVTPTGRTLLASWMTRDMQLAQSSNRAAQSEDASQTLETALSVDTMLLTPRSGQTLLGAVLNRFQPEQVVEWPATTSLIPEARRKLEARGILVRDFSDFVQQERLN